MFIEGSFIKQLKEWSNELNAISLKNIPKWKKSLVYNGVSGNENLTFNENGVTYFLCIDDLNALPREE